MTLIEINNTLQDDRGRYRHKVIQTISERSGVTQATVRNVLKRYHVRIDVNTKIKVLDTAKEVAEEYQEALKQLKSYENT